MRDVDFIRPVAMALTLLTFVLLCLGVTSLGDMRIYRFTVGEMALATAIAYSLQSDRNTGRFTPIVIPCWFLVASLNFALAAWRTTG